jgi:hypothetical protein
VPLNAFQSLVRDWEKLHPYNAAQAMRIRGSADSAAVARAWADAIEAAGLGRVAVDPTKGRTFRHETLNGELARYPVRMLPPGSDLGDYISSELNRAFDDPGEPPFRPFVIPLPGDPLQPRSEGGSDGTQATYYLGVVYQHWVADSTAIRLLMKDWFVRLYDPAQARRQPMRHARHAYRTLFGPRRGGWQPADIFLNLLRRHWRYRGAKKVQTFGPKDYPMKVLLRPAPEGLIDRLADYARGRGLKLNDLFLAALAESCNKVVPMQHRRSRQGLAVATIVDLRPHATEDLTDTFGLFLGFTEVVCGPRDLREFDRLVASVATQNRIHRRRGIRQSSLAWLVAAWTARRFLPARKIYHFYRKETPLVGGVSNVNLNCTWAAEYSPQTLLEYIRVSPTGPLVPLVLAVTTLGRQLHLSMTFRPALLSDQAAADLAGRVLARLECVSKINQALDNGAAK